MKPTLILAATAALLSGTSALAQTTVTDTTATTATTGDGSTTQTTVAATVPTTKIVSESADTVTEKVTAAPMVTDGTVQTATTVRAADGQDLVKTTVNADGTATTSVAADVPIKKSVKYQDGMKIEKTTSTVVTDAPVNVVTTNSTSDGQAVAVSTTATPDGNASAIAPATATTTTMTGPSSMPMTADASTSTSSSGQTWNVAGFDANNDGALTPLEFGQMVLASQAPASGGMKISDTARYSKRANNPATDVLNQTAAAFGKADMNRDFRISSDELSSWQSMGSPM